MARRSSSSAATFLGAFVVGAIVAAGCGSSADDSEFGNGGPRDDGSRPGESFSNPTDPNAPVTPPCEGLQCKQVACPGGGTTSLSGKVYDPSGTVPLYNAVVYVPNADLAPFAEGITCDRCGTTPSGKPVTTALTDATGSFTLKNVPVGVDVPLVVQIGRWRRKVTVPAANVAQCADAAIDAGLTRLPRSKAEGDIPRIAITTGNADSLECFVRKLGLEAPEFSNPGGAGRVQLFQGLRSGNRNGSAIDGSTPPATALWDDLATMKKYDMVILSCEGDENNSTKSQAARQNLSDYLNAGGRVFASHFHYTWLKNGVAPLPTTANWTGATLQNDRNVFVDTSFAKGKDFSTWLDTVGATTMAGSATIAATELRADVTTVPATGSAPDTSRRWLFAKDAAKEETKFFSFNTPIGTQPDMQCGRGVFTDIHVSSGDASGGTFPGNCTTSGFTSQEKALLFLMFDLASCIQDDNKPPTAPPAGPSVK